MIKESVTIQEVIDLLNSAIEKDREAMTELCKTRVKVNDELAEHPTIQAHCYNSDGEEIDDCSVGLVGIVNGIFGVDEKLYGCIGAVYDDDDRLIEFRRI